MRTLIERFLDWAEWSRSHLHPTWHGFHIFVAPVLLPTSILVAVLIPASLLRIGDHGDVLLVGMGVLVVLFGLRVYFHDHERREDAKIAKHTSQVVAALEESRQYPARVANIYGPISRELRRLQRQVDELRKHAHSHPASVPIHLEEIPLFHDQEG